MSFVPLNNIAISNAQHKLYIELSFEELCGHATKLLNTSSKEESTVMDMTIGVEMHIKTLLAPAKELLRETAETCESLLSTIKRKRTKRAILNLGSALHHLFGVADDTQVHDLESEIETVKKAVHDFAKVEDREMTVLNKTLLQLKTDAEAVTNLTKGMELLTKDKAFQEKLLEQATNETKILAKAMYTQQIALHTYRVAMTLNQRVSAVEEIILAATMGLLHRNLISPQKLKVAVQTLVDDLPPGYVPLIDLEEIHLYYQEKIVSSFVRDQAYIGFLISIPLKTMESTFHLFRARSFPTQIFNSTLFGSIHSTPAYLAVSESHQSYLELVIIVFLQI